MYTNNFSISGVVIVEASECDIPKGYWKFKLEGVTPDDRPCESSFYTCKPIEIELIKSCKKYDHIIVDGHISTYSKRKFRKNTMLVADRITIC